MTREEFWSSIEASNEERTKGEYYLDERGLEEHCNVLSFLQSFKRNKNRKIKYTEIATVLRYDKRIRRCLFRFIGVVEERIRAYFLNAFRDDASQIKQTKNFKKSMVEWSNDLYNAITHLTFGPLIQLLVRQNSEFKNSIFGIIQNRDFNLKSLIDLRNQVYHNKFLLNNLEFRECKFNGVKQSSLYANIKNLCYFSDENSRKGLIKGIKECTFYHQAKHEHQVKWVLPKDVIVSIDDVFLV